jgi:hypothetical protein
LAVVRVERSLATLRVKCLGKAFSNSTLSHPLKQHKIKDLEADPRRADQLRFKADQDEKSPPVLTWRALEKASSERKFRR